MPSLADYLTKNYLTADVAVKSSGEKRKRKNALTSSAGILITEDDAEVSHGGEGEEEDGPTTVSGNSAEFRKSKKSSWKTIGVPAPSDAEQVAADAIIASAAAENHTLGDGGDEQPQIVEEVEALRPAKMESGTYAGLQSAAQVQAALEARKAEERRRFEAEEPEATGKGQETIYRDASGRVINVAMKRAEARRKAEEEERKKAEELENQKGDVQRIQKEARKKQLEDAKFLTVGRYADDVEMNEELKERDRWNDPAAEFLTKKKEGRTATGKPNYKGSAAPNRYGIKPGYRWDGVDRGNGFEKEYFAAQNRRQNVKDLTYAWQMDE